MKNDKQSFRPERQPVRCDHRLLFRWVNSRVSNDNRCLVAVENEKSLIDMLTAIRTMKSLSVRITTAICRTFYLVNATSACWCDLIRRMLVSFSFQILDRNHLINFAVSIEQAAAVATKQTSQVMLWCPAPLSHWMKTLSSNQWHSFTSYFSRAIPVE